MLDPGSGSFQLVLSDEDAEFSAFDTTSDGATAFLGDKDGNLDILDVRSSKKAGEGVNLHPKKINTVHVRSKAPPPPPLPGSLSHRQTCL